MLFKSTLLLPALLALGLATAVPGPEVEEDLVARGAEFGDNIAARGAEFGDNIADRDIEAEDLAAHASAVSLHSDTMMMEGFAARAIGSTTTVRTDAAEGKTGISTVKGAAKRFLSILAELRKQNG
ncbi:uncharacterized protein TrAtP1_000008 [Trichoderma atroviride]|uniref:uncharacterized protein n=1 Tax=Hypocrea atroviridis TaxID=63577 RepID=UPI003326493B|nr:hypothetical protein TrAtP1_000008 [Trichoderma atroviride]